MTDTAAPPTADGIEAAARRIDPAFTDTPLISHPGADAALGRPLLAKVETLNPVRCFKGRGTDWFMARCPRDDTPLVTASAGNFGQGLAFAARKYGRRLAVYTSTVANPLKIEAMRRLSADVISEGDDFDAAKLAAHAHAARVDGRFVEDGAEREIAEGAGTIALEVTRELTRRGGAIEAIVVPLGNGALLTGIGTWIKAELPACRVIGVVAEGAPSMLLSWRDKRPVSTPSADTIADGIAVREPVPYALRCMEGTVDEVWTVSEAAIRAGMRFCHQHYGLVVEPAGAAGVGAVIDQGVRLGGGPVATVLCGGNLTVEQMRLYLGI